MWYIFNWDMLRVKNEKKTYNCNYIFIIFSVLKGINFTVWFDNSGHIFYNSLTVKTLLLHIIRKLT